MQRRDDLPYISDPGKISLFGGRREGTETFLECVVREVHEEIGSSVLSSSAGIPDRIIQRQTAAFAVRCFSRGTCPPRG
ncbi:NUDIX domain-containing protein [Bradyrhizobium sp. 6(2017)]|uniref:NUDIX domain-containing protein n=2 Tax=unclassified Bradyrhizobium TaxID=2631580 RepID=UPI000403E3DD